MNSVDARDSLLPFATEAGRDRLAHHHPATWDVTVDAILSVTEANVLAADAASSRLFSGTRRCQDVEDYASTVGFCVRWHQLCADLGGVPTGHEWVAAIEQRWPDDFWRPALCELARGRNTADDVVRGLRYRLGLIYCAFLRELQALARLRQTWAFEVHPVCDMSFGADLWMPSARPIIVACLMANGIYLGSDMCGRKTPAGDRLDGVDILPFIASDQPEPHGCARLYSERELRWLEDAVCAVLCEQPCPARLPTLHEMRTAATAPADRARPPFRLIRAPGAPNGPVATPADVAAARRELEALEASGLHRVILSD